MKYQLYSETEIKEKPSRKKVYIESYIIGNNKPTVIVCPGGSYSFVSDSNEGKPFAKELNKNGYNAFVLFYSVGKAAKMPAPFEDLAKSIYFIKTKQKELHIDAEHFALIGSSAGGHLCALFGEIYASFEKDNKSLKPNAIVLAYPVITMGKMTHKISRIRLLGISSSDTEIKNASVEEIASKDYPPTFIWHNKDDRTVSYNNSLMLYQRLTKRKVNCEFLLFNKGGHGIGLARNKEAKNWFEKAISFLNNNSITS